MRWVRPLGYILVFYISLLGSHLLAFHLGKQVARGELAQLYVRLNEAARVDAGVTTLLSAWERDLQACHQRLTRIGLRHP